jgi:protein gp37
MARGNPEKFCQACSDFTPHFHPERLDLLGRGRPRVIFADSMSDWWSPGVEVKWRSLAMQAMRDDNAHRFVVLTKRPDLIHPMTGGWWPSNAWLGVSITSGADWWRWEALAKLPGHIHKMISVEPLLGGEVGGKMHFGYRTGHLMPEWVIVGPQSGPGAVKPKAISQERIRAACKDIAIPLFEKAGLPLQPPVRQMPAELAMVFRKGGLTS